MTLATTVNSLCERVRRDALLSLVGPIYTLRTAYMAPATTLELNETPEHMSTGSVVAIDAELFFVKSVDAGSLILSVVPGYYGSTNANHDAGSVVEVDPRTPKAAMIDWAEQEIRSWKKTLYRTVTTELTFSRHHKTYDLTGATDVDFLLDVRQEPVEFTIDGIHSSWTADTWPHVEARLVREMNATDFPSGFALQLTGFPRADGRARVTYAAPFNLATFTLATDLVADVGLEEGHLDVLEMGVRWRALSSGIVARTDYRAAGMSRDAEEVSLLDIVRAVDMARSMRDERLAHESLALRSRFPYRSR